MDVGQVDRMVGYVVWVMWVGVGKYRWVGKYGWVGPFGGEWMGMGWYGVGGWVCGMSGEGGCVYTWADFIEKQMGEGMFPLKIPKNVCVHSI